jgi:D-alanyl-D-alanine dipeptidase
MTDAKILTLVFYQIGITPVTMGALPAAVAAAILHVQHAVPVAEGFAVLRSKDAVLLSWDDGGLLIEDGHLWPLSASGVPLPLSGLDVGGWADGEQAHVVARGEGVIALRPADALEGVGMVRMDDLLPGAVIDMRYTTADNFTGVQLYPTGTGCYLLPATADALIAANHKLHAEDRALRVYDCYRPLSVQEQMWAVFPKPGFVARPSATGSVHNRGAAVDVGLVDGDGMPVALPTDHDDFTPAAAAAASGHSPEATKNRAILQAAMRASGFSTIRSEWWHFNGPGGSRLAMDLPFPGAESENQRESASESDF